MRQHFNLAKDTAEKVVKDSIICLPNCGRRPTEPIGCNCLKKSKAMFAREIEHFLGMAPNLMRQIGK